MDLGDEEEDDEKVSTCGGWLLLFFSLKFFHEVSLSLFRSQ